MTELRDHLVRTLIAGEVATPRQNNLLHFRRMAAGKPYYQFGLEFEREWTFEDIFALMVKRCGIDPDPSHFYGDDTIDPDLTIDALEAMGDRIGQAAERKETVVLATGHPSGLLPVYLAVGAGAAGARLPGAHPRGRLVVRGGDAAGAPDPAVSATSRRSRC